MLGSASAWGGGSSGLRGTFTAGPIQPVCRKGQTCDGRAAHARLFFTRAGITTSALTNAQGVYRITLAPGWYSVRTRYGISHLVRPARVLVVAGRYRVVDFSADTGIR